MKMKRQRTSGVFGLLLAAALTFVALSAYKPAEVKTTTAKYSFSVTESNVSQVQVTGIVIEKFQTAVQGETYNWLTLYNEQTKERYVIQVQDPAVFHLAKYKERLVLRCRPLKTTFDARQYRC